MPDAHTARWAWSACRIHGKQVIAERGDWYGRMAKLYRVTVDRRQHCTDGSFRFCRWRAHREAWSEDSGPEALSTHGQSFALHVFYAILPPIASELSANCCRTMTMTRYSKGRFTYELA